MYICIYTHIIITYPEWAKLLHPHLPVIFIVYPGTIAFQSSPPSTSWKNIQIYSRNSNEMKSNDIQLTTIIQSKWLMSPLWALLLSKPPGELTNSWGIGFGSQRLTMATSQNEWQKITKVHRQCGLRLQPNGMDNNKWFALHRIALLHYTALHYCYIALH